MKINRVILFSLAITLLLSGGCKTADTQTTDNPTTYEWAYQLQENVEPVPTETISEGQPLSASSDQRYMEGAWPWGSPENLIRPVNTTTPGMIASSNAKPFHEERASIPNADKTGLSGATQSFETTKPGSAPSKSNSSQLENLYLGQFERKANRKLVQAGYEIFSEDARDTEITGPVPGNYIIGPGDELVLSLSGGVDAYHRLSVDRDGYLSIPDFGLCAIAGRSFGETRDVILNFLQQRRHGFDLSVSMGRLRQIQVNVVGRVKIPGAVEVPALGTVISALAAAGGPTKDGSLRRVILHRVDPEEQDVNIDLYDFLKGGNQGIEAVTLRDGDTIRIPPVGPTIGIAGYVQQPGIYEITTKETTVRDALELAGGLTPFSFTPLARLERTIDGRGRINVDIELSEAGMAHPMADGELLMVEAVDDDRQPVVRIEGEVARPGDFQHQPGMTLADLVRRADGLTVNAYMPQAFISRQLGESATFETIPDRTGHLQSRRVIVVDLSRATAGDPAHDIPLMPLDLITIRSRANAQVRASVEIIGSVQRPGKYELTAGMRVSDLVAVAGNPTPEVYFDEAELIRRVFDEATRQLDVKRFRFNLQQALRATGSDTDSLNPVLCNGDRLVIRSLQRSQIRVRIGGRVRFPGEYIFPAGARLTDLMAAAGGILPDADLRAAIFTRESTRRLQQERIEHLTERTRRLSEGAFERMVQTGSSGEGLAAKLALEQTQSTLGRMRSLEADGRIVIPFNTPDFPNSGFNLPLESGDSLDVPRYHSTVSVAGHVFRPITLVAGKPLTVELALEQAGGMTEFADEDLLYVVRADGRVDSVAQKPSRLRKNTELHAGDVLLVPSKPMERTFGAKFADALLLARHMAEVALISSQVGKSVDMTFVSPLDSSPSSTDPSILRD